MTAAHTPGLWAARYGADNSGDCGILAPSQTRPGDWMVIAEVFAAREVHDEKSPAALADACVMAAAPELLEAARDFVAPYEGVEMIDGKVSRARAAIAKAMGVA